MSSRRFLILLAWVALLVPAVAAQQGEDERDWGAGEENLVYGKYRQAVSQYRSALEADPNSRGDRFGLAMTLLETGVLDEARKLFARLVTDFPDDHVYRCRLGHVLFLRGDVDGAEKAYRAVLAKEKEHFEANARLGRLLTWRGKREAARAMFEVPVRVAGEQPPKDADRLLYLGWCLWGLGRLGDATKAFVSAFEDTEFYPACESLIRLYLQNNHVFGRRPLYMKPRDAAFQNNPNQPDLRLLMADVYMARMEHHLARQQLKKALAANPNLVHGLCLKAFYAIDRMDFEGARKILDKAKKINPADKEVLAYAAGLAFIRDDAAEAEAGWKRVLAIDPRYGHGFHILAQLLGNLRRYRQAEQMAARAVKVEPELWSAWDSLVRYRLHLGKEKEALAALKVVWEGDPYADYHPWRANIRELYSHMDEFLVHSWGPFRLRLHAEDNPILRRYLKEALDESLKTLSRKYGFTPKGPIRVEVFSKQLDFAVRTVGVPGIRGVLGACFGQVITMNSPRALPAGWYVWKATLWHEFAHVITLQMSSYRISRWLTEGLSVYEEKCQNPAWEDVEDEDLHSALVNDELAPIKELDGLFRSPRIGFAYLQSLHLVEFIIARLGGFERIPKMIKAYARGHSTEKMLKNVFNLSAEQFDKQFADWVRARFAERSIQVAYAHEAYENARAILDLDPRNVDALRVLAWSYFQQGPDKVVDCEATLGRLLSLKPKDPSGIALRGELALRSGQRPQARKFLEQAHALGRDEFYLRLHLAELSASAGETDKAIDHYKAAQKLFPRYVGPGNPYLELAGLLRKKGKTDEARRQIEAFVSLQATDVNGRVELASHFLKSGDSSRALQLLTEANQVNPFDVRIHRMLADVLRAMGRGAQALDEIDLAILLLEEADPRKKPRGITVADLRLERARILRKMGRHEESLREATDALKGAPDHAGLKAFLQSGTGNKGD